MPNIEEVADYLREHQLRLATAESCTAGLIAARLAEVPGAGQVLDCAFVVYSPEAKMGCLGVSADTLREHNLTSEPVAREMVEGAMRASQASVAIANTGLADDSDPDVPAGTQCFAWAFRDGEALRVYSETRRFPGDRQAVRAAAAAYALGQIPFYHERDGSS